MEEKRAQHGEEGCLATAGGDGSAGPPLVLCHQPGGRGWDTGYTQAMLPTLPLFMQVGLGLRLQFFPGCLARVGHLLF